MYTWEPVLTTLKAINILKHDPDYKVDPYEATNIVSDQYSIGATYIPETNVVILTKTTVIPGCRTLRNGDPGYPDDIDVADIETLPADSSWQIAAKLMTYCSKEALYVALDAYSQECLARELLGEK